MFIYIYAVIANVALVNLLIAMFSDSVHQGIGLVLHRKPRGHLTCYSPGLSRRDRGFVHSLLMSNTAIIGHAVASWAGVGRVRCWGLGR